MSLISDYLVGYTYDSILQSALSRIPDTIDKREGSIIRDAISPACYELAIWYAKLAELLDMSINYVGKLERGTIIPSALVIFKLSKILRVDINDFFKEIE